MSASGNSGWKPGKRDAFFLVMVAVVVALLVFGTGERTTRTTPDDEVHQKSSSRAACMACHNVDGIYPQPKGHTRADQCFQCHAQPENWIGAGR